MPIQEGDIVRVTGKSGDWRVLHGEGLTNGTHQRQICVEAVGESWVKRLVIPASQVYRSFLAPELRLDRS